MLEYISFKEFSGNLFANVHFRKIGLILKFGTSGANEMIQQAKALDAFWPPHPLFIHIPHKHLIQTNIQVQMNKLKFKHQKQVGALAQW